MGPTLNWAPPVVSSAPAPLDARAVESSHQAQNSGAPKPERALTRRQMRELGVGGFVSAPSENDEAERAAAAQFAPVQPEAAPIELPPHDVSDTGPGRAEESVPPERPRFRDRASRATSDPEIEPEEARRVPQPAYLVPSVETAFVQVSEPPALIEPPARAPFTGRPAVDIAVAELVDDTPSPSISSAPIEFVSTPVSPVNSATEPEVIVAELEAPDADSSAFEDLLFPSGQTDASTSDPERADATPAAFNEFFGAPKPQTTKVQGAAFIPPVGHWSTQAMIDDGEQVQANTFARNVAATSGATGTSALVLPTMPTAEDIMGPLSRTGEILITGSINLPSSVGTSGVYPARYDHSDVDALLEADDREDYSDPESAPVRAIRAVSTNTGSADVINSMKPRKASRLPIVLIVSAAVMAVGVVVLLVAGFIFKIF